MPRPSFKLAIATIILIGLVAPCAVALAHNILSTSTPPSHQPQDYTLKQWDSVARCLLQHSWDPFDQTVREEGKMVKLCALYGPELEGLNAR